MMVKKDDLLRPKQWFSDVIKKDVKIQDDGNQFLFRFPKSISEELGIKKGQLMTIEYNKKTKKVNFIYNKNGNKKEK